MELAIQLESIPMGLELKMGDFVEYDDFEIIADTCLCLEYFNYNIVPYVFDQKGLNCSYTAKYKSERLIYCLLYELFRLTNPIFSKKSIFNISLLESYDKLLYNIDCQISNKKIEEIEEFFHLLNSSGTSTFCLKLFKKYYPQLESSSKYGILMLLNAYNAELACSYDYENKQMKMQVIINKADLN